MGTHCSNCERTYIPAALFCERCLAQLDEWVDVGIIGDLFTFTLLYANYDGSPRETPEIVVFVKLADGGLIHRLDEVDPEDVAIGMTVEAIFKPKAERQGSILDITHFKPVSE